MRHARAPAPRSTARRRSRRATRCALKIAEPHQFNLSDGVARVGGYPVVVAGAIYYIGQEHKVRIERAARTTAYATLLDAKPKALEMPQDPAEFEIPEFDREVGERLELEDRSRNRRGRTGRTPKKPARRSPRVRSRAKPPDVVRGEPVEAEAARRRAEGEEAAAKPQAPPRHARRRGEGRPRGRPPRPTIVQRRRAAARRRRAEPASRDAQAIAAKKPAPKPRRPPCDRRQAQGGCRGARRGGARLEPNGDEPEAKPDAAAPHPRGRQARRRRSPSRGRRRPRRAGRGAASARAGCSAGCSGE